MKELREMLGIIVFGTFIAMKLSGPLAAWSWWWVLMPIVPAIAFALGAA